MLFKSRMPGQSFVIGGEYLLTLVEVRKVHVILLLSKSARPKEATYFKLRLGESIPIMPRVKVLHAGTVTCPRWPRKAGAVCIGVSWSEDYKVYSKEVYDIIHARLE